MGDYQSFVASKLAINVPTGIEGATCEDARLFPHQRDLVGWSLRRGRAAVFAQMGLGKSRIGCSWAQRVHEHTSKPVLVLTPLAVAQQMRAEAAELGIDATVVRTGAEVRPGINICNYERMHRLDTSVFGGVVCDESGCIKGIGSKTLAQLIDAFGSTAYRLACTATPSPNSWDELCQHAELLGISKRSEVLAEYFSRDGGSTQDWDVKGHARKAWWRFVASWGALVRSPADLGHDASAYELPPLTKEYHVIPASAEIVHASGMLFAQPARTLMERRRARRDSLDERVRQCAELVNSDNERWCVWSELNDESKALAKAIDGSVELTGSMDVDAKEAAIERFLDGSARVLVSKPSLCGHGLNLQFCNRVAFVGISDSFEQQFQAIGRCHRFGQKRPVQVHFFLSETEQNVLDNVRRKEADAARMGDELSRETAEMVRENVTGQRSRMNAYEPMVVPTMPEWLKSAG
jgi:superfamily II DNA or RNA helicase